MKEINPLYVATVRQDQECCIQFCASLYKKDMDTVEQEQWSTAQMAGGWSRDGEAAGAGCAQP